MKYIFYILVVAFFYSCQSEKLSNKNTSNDAEWINPNTIQASPIIRDRLTLKQHKEIDYLYNTFKEVDQTSKEKWTEDFKRDQDPDREIEIWMMMAHSYNSYCENKEIDLELKKEVYQIVLMRSTANKNEVLSHIKLKYLTEKEAIEIMEYYTLNAKPIRVIEK